MEEDLRSQVKRITKEMDLEEQAAKPKPFYLRGKFIFLEIIVIVIVSILVIRSEKIDNFKLQKQDAKNYNYCIRMKNNGWVAYVDSYLEKEETIEFHWDTDGDGRESLMIVNKKDVNIEKTKK